MTVRARALLVAAALGAAPALHAQPVSLEKGVQAAGLWCFPLVSDTRQWVYLPNGARLAKDDAGRPQFSFLRYTLDTTAAGAGVAFGLEVPAGRVAVPWIGVEGTGFDTRSAPGTLANEAAGAAAGVSPPALFGAPV